MKDIKDLEWKEISSSMRCFQLEGEPELIHVIKTGFKDFYMVVHEDAYEYSMGKIEYGTQEMIESRYKIKLS